MKENIISEFLEKIVSFLLPIGVAAAETIGVIIILYSLLRALWQACANHLQHTNYDVHLQFSAGLVMALQFKMAAEILKTILVTTYSELFILAGVFTLRVLMSTHLQHEIREDEERDKKLSEEAAEKMSE